jgi:hypothetical protein
LIFKKLGKGQKLILIFRGEQNLLENGKRIKSRFFVLRRQQHYNNRIDKIIEINRKFVAFFWLWYNSRSSKDKKNMPKYSREELWGLYQELPKELQRAIFSEKTAEIIYNACKENGVEKTEDISFVAEQTGYVLIGLLSPDEFKKTLLQKFNIKREAGEKICQAINDFVFLPLRRLLEKIYDAEIKPQLKPETSPAKN